MKQSQSIEINRPIQDVFDYTTDNPADWSLIVVEDELVESVNEGGVGTKFRIVTEERGQRMEFESVVTEHAPPHRSAIRMSGSAFDIHANYDFEQTENGTRVTQNSEVFAKTILTKIMFALMGPFMKKSGCEALLQELNSLKDHMEHPEKFTDS